MSRLSDTILKKKTHLRTPGQVVQATSVSPLNRSKTMIRKFQLYSQQFHEYQQNYNNSLSPQIIEYQKEHNICPCVKPVNGIQPSLN